MRRRGVRGAPSPPLPRPAARVGGKEGGPLGVLSRSSLRKGRVGGPWSALGCWTPGFPEDQRFSGCAQPYLAPHTCEPAAEAVTGRRKPRGGSPLALVLCLPVPLAGPKMTALSPVSVITPRSFSICITFLGLFLSSFSLSSSVISALSVASGFSASFWTSESTLAIFVRAALGSS